MNKKGPNYFLPLVVALSFLLLFLLFSSHLFIKKGEIYQLESSPEASPSAVSPSPSVSPSSTPASPSPSASTQSPTSAHSIDWSAGNISFQADDFYLKGLGRKYYANTGNVGKSTFAGGVDVIQLQIYWAERGDIVRITVDFHSDGKKWQVGFFEGEIGSTRYRFNFLWNNPLGQTATQDDVQQTSGDGEIYFKNLRVKAFTNKDKEFCVQEGERFTTDPTYTHPGCCSGLNQIGCEDENSCTSCYGIAYCARCGDGSCNYPENKCNCPRDCGGTGGVTASSSPSQSPIGSSGTPVSSSPLQTKAINMPIVSVLPDAVSIEVTASAATSMSATPTKPSSTTIKKTSFILLLFILGLVSLFTAGTAGLALWSHYKFGSYQKIFFKIKNWLKTKLLLPYH